MADEIEIVKTERAAAPDGAEWMDQPPAGVQPDDFVCGLRRGGVKCWIDNDGLVLDHAVFMMTRDLVALITEAVRLGDRQWVSLLAACKDAAVEAANETAAAVTRSLNAVVADVRKAIDADQGANTYDALRAFADSAKVSSRALAEYANMLGCGEGEIGDHIRRIISAVDGCSAGTVAAKVEELRDAILVVERSESKRHAEITSAARLLSDAGFSGATLEDRVKAVLRERASLEAENAELVAEINELKRVPCGQGSRGAGEQRRQPSSSGTARRHSALRTDRGCPSCGARHVDAGEFATKPHHTQSAMTAKNRRRKVESVCFVVTGEFVTSHARDLVLSDQPSSAWRFIVETLLGDGIETAARDVLEGRRDFGGDSSAGITMVDGGEDASAYLKQADYVYAGRWKSKRGWCRPCAKITIWNSASGSHASMLLNRGEIMASHEDSIGKPLRAWVKARAEFHCDRHEHPEIVMIDGQSTYVIFESCGEPPHWSKHRNFSAQAAVDDCLRAGRSLWERGGEPTRSLSIRAATEEMIAADDLDRDQATALRELAQDAEDAEREIRMLQIGDEVRAKAAGDTFKLTLEDGRVVDVPRVPFMRWALLRHDPERAPEWEPVSPPDLKLPNDDRVHSDWLLGAGLSLREAYDPNVNRPAWTEAGRLQFPDLEEPAPPPAAPSEYPGIFAALAELRSKNHRGTVIVNAGPFTGTVGTDVAVLPDLSPLRVPEIEGARAVICETGGQASHLAIVARGMELTVMLVADACQVFTHGMRVSLSPKNGTITTMDEDE